jgi:hypothetical protein
LKFWIERNFPVSGKKFPSKWIKQVVSGGRVGVKINEEPGNFFKTHKGLRQGDPLSPLLFNLVAEALANMLERARRMGLIKGLIPELVEEGLKHLNYADDTIICMEVDRASIASVKFLLYCFENMSGLKIYFHKSELVVIGAIDEIANLLNCKEGALPFKYLGIPVSDRMLFAADLMEVGVKVEKRLPGWQALLLSSGGKSILIESSLSSLPIYTMGFYLLPEQVRRKMDTARSNFFWDSGQKKKYHMIR